MPSMKIEFLIFISLLLGCASSSPQYGPPVLERMNSTDVVSQGHFLSGKVTFAQIGLYIDNDYTHKIIPTGDSCDSYPVLKDTILSDYPEIARRAGVEGKIMIIAWIDTSGKVVKTKVDKSDAELFVKAALDAVYKSTYSPYRVDYHPMEFVSVLKFDYRLQKDK